jgi:hypothetical protein
VELKEELAARGFDHLSQQRLGQFVNRARSRLDSRYEWPYRLATTTSIATIADMGHVDTVLDSSQTYPLEQATLEEIQSDYFDLTTTGSPTYWYRTSTGVATYPVTTDTITVRYWKRSPLLTETDTPLSPSDYHMLIVDIATVMAERDRGNHRDADELQADIDRQIGEMVTDLIGQYGLQFTTVTYASEDW